MVFEIVFWLSILFIVYAYAGYPAVLGALSIFLRKDLRERTETFPDVSFIITAHNEEKKIREKLENTLAQDYPADKLQIIVASDGSTDGTDEIVRTYESRRVALIRPAKRGGKEYAQKCALDAASAEILVFSDVATVLDSSGLRNIVRSFGDPTVGCVSSVDRFVDKNGNVSGEGAYVRYEMFLRNLESRVNVLVGLSGSFFAARKEICRSWATDMPSDFNTLISSVRKGYRGICNNSAIGYYPDLSEKTQEFSRKVRTVVRGIRVFMRSLPMLNVFRYGLFSWQLFSHKLCRWAVPFGLVTAAVSNVFLAEKSYFYLCLLVVQLLFYVTAILGLWTRSQRQFFKIPGFFVLVNASIMVAWYKYLKGEHFVTWEPSTR